MIVRLSGKGVICDVFYISESKFDQIVSESGGEGIGPLIRENCDQHFIVSRGFFVDGNHKTKLQFSNREVVVEDSSEGQGWPMWLSVLPENHPFVASTNDCVGESDDPDDLEACAQDSFIEELRTEVSDDDSDPTEDQVAIVAYVEFEDGLSETHLDCDDENFPEDFRIKSHWVDQGSAFVVQSTYHEMIVGSEEYGSGEHAIIGFDLNGLEVEVSPPTFTQSLSRTRLYKFDADEQEHSLDFSGSSSFVWGSQKGTNQKTFIKKTISMRVDDALAIELYKKTIDGVEVVVRRESTDDWNDITLTIPQDSKLPANGQQFSTTDLNFEVSIEDISPQCSIQYTILTEVSPEIEEQIETYGEDDNWADEWEHIGSDYIIQSYKIA